MRVATVLNMPTRRTIETFTAVVPLTTISSVSGSADEKEPVSTTTTVVEKFDDESRTIGKFFAATEATDPDAICMQVSIASSQGLPPSFLAQRMHSRFRKAQPVSYMIFL